MARYNRWDPECIELLDEDDEGEKWIEDPPSSPSPGMCGSTAWYYNEQEDTPEQHMADLIEAEEKWMGEEDEKEGDGEMDEETNQGFQNLISVIGQNISLPQI